MKPDLRSPIQKTMKKMNKSAFLVHMQWFPSLHMTHANMDLSD